MQRLASTIKGGTLLVDSPGVVRGVAGAELLDGMMQAAAIDAILVLTHDSQQVPLGIELRSSSLPVFAVAAPTQAKRPGKGARGRRRTELWNAHLSDGVEVAIPVDSLHAATAGHPFRLARPPGGATRRQPDLRHGRSCTAESANTLRQTARRVSRTVRRQSRAAGA